MGSVIAGLGVDQLFYIVAGDGCYPICEGGEAARQKIRQASRDLSAVRQIRSQLHIWAYLVMRPLQPAECAHEYLQVTLQLSGTWLNKDLEHTSTPPYRGLSVDIAWANAHKARTKKTKKLLRKAKLPPNPRQSPWTPFALITWRAQSIGPLNCLSLVARCRCNCKLTAPVDQFILFVLNGCPYPRHLPFKSSIGWATMALMSELTEVPEEERGPRPCPTCEEPRNRMSQYWQTSNFRLWCNFCHRRKIQ